MLEDLIKDMEQKRLIIIHKNKLTPEILKLLELFRVYRYTEPLETNESWWNVRAHVIANIDGGSQHCLTNYKGKR